MTEQEYSEAQEQLEVFSISHSTYPGREQNLDVFIGEVGAWKAEIQEIYTPEQIEELGLKMLITDKPKSRDLIQATVIRKEGKLVGLKDVTKITRNRE